MHRPLAQRIAGHGVPTDQQAFREYVSMADRVAAAAVPRSRAALELLPMGWTGVTAGNLFAEMNEQLHEAAMRHAVSLIRA